MANRSFRLETLESRNLMAGNVTASLVGGVLSVQGDALGNSVQVQEVQPNQFRVVSIDNGATTVNGTTLVDLYGTVNRVEINMGGGDDFVRVFNFPSITRLDVHTGEGNDLVKLQGVHVSGPALINGLYNPSTSATLTQPKTVEVVDSSFGNLAVYTGNGRDVITLDSVQTRSTLDLYAADEYNQITVSGSQVGGGLYMTGGAHLDKFTVSETAVGTNARLAFRPLVVSTGGYYDNVTLKGVTAHDSAEIYLGQGTNFSVDQTATVTGSTFHKGLVIDADSGHNRINVSHSSIGMGVGSYDLDIDTGNGSDAVYVFNTYVDGNVRIDTFNGYDVIYVYGGTTITGDLLINSGAFMDYVNVNRTTVGGDLRIYTEDGDDTVSLGSLSVADLLFVALGNDNDRLYLYNGITANQGLFYGQAGNDYLYLQNAMYANQFLFSGF